MHQNIWNRRNGASICMKAEQKSIDFYYISSDFHWFATDSRNNNYDWSIMILLTLHWCKINSIFIKSVQRWIIGATLNHQNHSVSITVYRDQMDAEVHPAISLKRVLLLMKLKYDLIDSDLIGESVKLCSSNWSSKIFNTSIKLKQKWPKCLVSGLISIWF